MKTVCVRNQLLNSGMKSSGEQWQAHNPCFVKKPLYDNCRRRAKQRAATVAGGTSRLTWHLFLLHEQESRDQPLPNGKSSIKESGTTKERKKRKKLSLAFRFARHTCRTATGNARGNLRVMQGQEMRRGRDTWKKATRQFFWGQQMDWDFISISGFKPPQFERMMASGHICMWSASYTTQGAQMPWGWELSKYLIGKISSMYIRQRKLLWNKYFPQSVKTRASEDLNSSIGSDGLTNTFSLPPQPHRLSLFED